MSANYDKSINTNKKVQSATERLAALEENYTGLIGQLNGVIGQLQNQLAGLTEIVDALVKSVGVEAVTHLVVESRQEKIAERVEEAKQFVAKKVADGEFVPAETIGENSFLVGRELDKEGKQVGIGRTHIETSKITDDNIKLELLGQAVGFVLKAEKGDLEVQEIYNIVTPAPVPEVTPVEPVAEVAVVAPTEAAVQ